MKKLFASILMLVMVMSMLAACGGSDKTTETSANGSTEESETKTKSASNKETKTAKPVVMKVGHIQPVESARHKTLLNFKKNVEEKTNGEITVEIYPSAQLGTDQELVEMVKAGTLQGHRGGAFEVYSPELEIYTMPFLFTDTESVNKITRGPIGEAIAENSKKNNVIILATGVSGGLRNFTNNDRPITKPEDLEGLKMRCPPVEVTVKTMEALGASVASIPYSETYMALKTGVADGQENPYVYIYDAKFYEVQEYLTEVNYQVHPEPFCVNLNWYDSLTAEQQEVLKACASDMMAENDNMMKKDQEDAFDVIKNNVEITYLTDEQREVFIEACQPVYDEYIEKGVFKQEDIEAIRAAISQ